MDALSLLGWVLLTAAAFGLLVLSMVKAVRFAKKGTPGAEVLGAVFLLFGFGNFRDPTNDLVHQAQRLKRREEDDSGDPPDPVTPTNRRKADGRL
jgi:hypothetical protein